jgi:hypothetical protein
VRGSGRRQDSCVNWRTGIDVCICVSLKNQELEMKGHRELIESCGGFMYFQIH